MALLRALNSLLLAVAIIGPASALAPKPSSATLDVTNELQHVLAASGLQAAGFPGEVSAQGLHKCKEWCGTEEPWAVDCT